MGKGQAGLIFDKAIELAVDAQHIDLVKSNLSNIRIKLLEWYEKETDSKECIRAITLELNNICNPRIRASRMDWVSNDEAYRIAQILYKDFNISHILSSYGIKWPGSRYFHNAVYCWKQEDLLRSISGSQINLKDATLNGDLRDFLRLDFQHHASILNEDAYHEYIGVKYKSHPKCRIALCGDYSLWFIRKDCIKNNMQYFVINNNLCLCLVNLSTDKTLKIDGYYDIRNTFKRAIK